MLSLLRDAFGGHWSALEIVANLVVFAHLVGALLLGFVVGYERSFNGRAAGMRTYGLVCMTSAALTVIAGYPGQWYGGHTLQVVAADPTRVIQGIVTGVGFLGAGVIMKDGLNISGLTTAASLWASSAIGVLVGIGFYGASILLTLMSAACMMWISRLESWLPSHPAVAVALNFRAHHGPDLEQLRQHLRSCGYAIAMGSFTIASEDGKVEWRFVAVTIDKNRIVSLPGLGAELAKFDGVEKYHVSHARN